MELSHTDRMRLRWRLCLAGFKPESSIAFRNTSPTGRYVFVAVPDSGAMAVVCTWDYGHLVWFGERECPKSKQWWTGKWKPDGDSWFDEDEFMFAALQGLFWAMEEPPAADA